MHYTDFIINADSTTDLRETLGQLMLAVHGHNAAVDESHRIAVSFPNATAGAVGAPPASGNRLRVFSASEQLTAFSASYWPARLLRLGMVSVTPPAVVPDNARGLKVTRDRKFERLLPNSSYLRRLARRAEARGDAVVSGVTVKGGNSFGLPLRSRSTGQSFHLDVQVKESPLPLCFSGISVYGLCGEKTVLPQF